mgnify:CR=1 FL=1
MWLSDEALDAWRAPPSGKPGGQRRYADIAIEAAEASFEIDGETYNAGSFVIPVQGNPDDLRERLGDAVSEYRFKAVGVSTPPDVPTHPVRAPRIAVMHTWQTTQTEGWIRVAFDEVGVPYDYISVHEVRDNPNLIERYDAIGLWREKTARGGKPVSTKTVLPGNHPIDGVADLQNHLLTDRRDQFAHALASKLLIYALGRTLDLGDEILLEDMSQKFAENDYRLPSLMEDIVTSKAFLSR